MFRKCLILIFDITLPPWEDDHTDPHGELCTANTCAALFVRPDVTRRKQAAVIWNVGIRGDYHPPF